MVRRYLPTCPQTWAPCKVARRVEPASHANARTFVSGVSFFVGLYEDPIHKEKNQCSIVKGAPQPICLAPWKVCSARSWIGKRLL